MDTVTSFFADSMANTNNSTSSTAFMNDSRNGNDDNTDGANNNPTLSSRRNSTKDNSSGGLSGFLGSASASSQQLLTEKFVEKMIYMALPSASSIGTGKNEVTSYAYRIASAKTRPGLSVQIMSKNFIMLNSRLSLPFLMIDEIIKLFNWENRNFTLVILFFVTYIILKPIPTLTSVPIFYILFGVMTPAYLKLHKPDEWNTILATNPVPANGPNLTDVELPKPVPELSKEFLLNLTDLQNHMSLYVIVFDIISKILCKFAFYKNEPLSVSIFILLLVGGLFNVFYLEVISYYIPFKLIFIILVWAFGISMHPQYRDYTLNSFSSEETRLRWVTLSNKWEEFILNNFDIQNPGPKDLKISCIYEIQKFNEELKAWELLGYCNDDYSLFSDLRIQEIDLAKLLNSLENTNGNNKKKMNLNDVKPPKDWCWSPKSQWNLDLNVTKWVKQNLLQCVEVDEEEKWVYDLNFPNCLARGEYRRRRWIRVCQREGIVDELSRRNSTVGSDANTSLDRQINFENDIYTSCFDDSDNEEITLMHDVLPRNLLSGVNKNPNK